MTQNYPQLKVDQVNRRTLQCFPRNSCLIENLILLVEKKLGRKIFNPVVGVSLHLLENAKEAQTFLQSR